MRRTALVFIFAIALLVAVAISVPDGGTTAQAHEGHTSCKGGATVADQFVPFPFEPPGPGFGPAASGVATSGPNAASIFVEIVHTFACTPNP